MNCRGCEASDPAFLCEICQCVKYCNPACKRRDWSDHRSMCKPCDDFELKYLKKEDKNIIIESANGQGAGQYVRMGVDFLTAYALALRWPREVFVEVLRSAPGKLDDHWLDVMQDYEKDEILKVAGKRKATLAELNDLFPPRRDDEDDDKDGEDDDDDEDDDNDDDDDEDEDDDEDDDCTVFSDEDNDVFIPKELVDVFYGVLLSYSTGSPTIAATKLQEFAYASRKHENVIILGSKSRVLKAVTVLLSDHWKVSIAVARYGLECISNMAAGDEHAQYVLGDVLDGVCDMVVDILQFYGLEDGDIAEWGCKAIHALRMVCSETAIQFERRGHEIATLLFKIVHRHVPITGSPQLSKASVAAAEAAVVSVDAGLGNARSNSSKSSAAGPTAATILTPKVHPGVALQICDTIECLRYDMSIEPNKVLRLLNEHVMENLGVTSTRAKLSADRAMRAFEKPL